VGGAPLSIAAAHGPATAERATRAARRLRSGAAAAAPPPPAPPPPRPSREGEPDRGRHDGPGREGRGCLGQRCVASREGVVRVQVRGPRRLVDLVVLALDFAVGRFESDSAHALDQGGDEPGALQQAGLQRRQPSQRRQGGLSRRRAAAVVRLDVAGGAEGEEAEGRDGVGHDGANLGGGAEAELGGGVDGSAAGAGGACVAGLAGRPDRRRQQCCESGAAAGARVGWSGDRVVAGAAVTSVDARLGDGRRHPRGRRRRRRRRVDARRLRSGVQHQTRHETAQIDQPPRRRELGRSVLGEASEQGGGRRPGPDGRRGSGGRREARCPVPPPPLGSGPVAVRVVVVAPRREFEAGDGGGDAGEGGEGGGRRGGAAPPRAVEKGREDRPSRLAARRRVADAPPRATGQTPAQQERRQLRHLRGGGRGGGPARASADAKAEAAGQRQEGGGGAGAPGLPKKPLLGGSPNLRR